MITHLVVGWWLGVGFLLGIATASGILRRVFPSQVIEAVDAAVQEEYHRGGLDALQSFVELVQAQPDDLLTREEVLTNLRGLMLAGEIEHDAQTRWAA